MEFTQKLKLIIAKLLGLIKRTEKYDDYFLINSALFQLKKDTKDTRDYKAVSAAIELPAKISLRQYCPKTKNQGNISSCGSHAWVTAYEIMLKKNQPNWFVEGSERHHYYTVRQKDYMNTYPEDSGQSLREGGKVLNQIGMCPEDLCKYIVADYNSPPSKFANTYPRFWRIAEYQRVWSVPDIYKILAEGRPVVFGTIIHSNFTNLKNYVLQMPTSKDIAWGSHGMVITGYDLAAKKFEVLNSHGKLYGDDGFFWITEEYMRKYLLDAWTLKLNTEVDV